eukprot:TRINITY_DN13790_c0_g1_i1.p1 TRINITY_DN13790_c0_g1~~TRINITY_DN13790_c0_g1_i1.p1  ORF type:complete len:656 (+),score=216.90 TRINITY_DN13790_c0_g1_i1:89-2056(+)
MALDGCAELVEAFDNCAPGTWQKFREHCMRELGVSWQAELRGFAEAELRESIREFWGELPQLPSALRRARATTALLNACGDQLGGSLCSEGAAPPARCPPLPDRRLSSVTGLSSARSSTSSRGSLSMQVHQDGPDADALGALPAAPAQRRRGDTSAMLRGLALFEKLPGGAIDALAECIRPEPHAPGGTIFRCGDKGSAMYVVLEGSVQLAAANGEPLGEVGARGGLGEISILYSDVSRQATARAGPHGATLGALSKTDLDRVCAGHRCRDEIMASAQCIFYVKAWFIGTVPLFAPMRGNTRFVDTMVAALQNHHTPAGAAIVTAGETGTDMFFLVHGECEILSKGRVVAAVRAGSYFGEKAMLYGGERTATVRAKSAAHMYRLTKAAFDGILDRCPECLEAVYGRAQESKHLKEHFIKTIPLFAEMTGNAEFVMNLALALTSRNFRKGEDILTEGATDTDMYLLAHGTVSVHKQRKEVARLNAGAFFGELSLVYNHPRQATVRAESPCHLYALSQEAFETIAAAFPAWWDAIAGDRKQGLFTKVEGVELARTSKYHNLTVPEVRGGRASERDLLRARMQRRETGAQPMGAEDRLREMMDLQLCTVCAEEERNAVFVPCGHAVCCRACATKLKSQSGKCPQCRAAVRQIVQAFFG